MVKWILPLLMAATATAQTVVTSDGDYIDVPADKDVVFIAKGLPKQCAVICTSKVMHPEPEPQEVKCGDGGLVISPSVCDPGDDN